MKRLAFFDEHRKKRYFLSRIWSSKSMCTWVMLNPSIADDNIDDNTIKNVLIFQKIGVMEDCRLLTCAAILALTQVVL